MADLTTTAPSPARSDNGDGSVRKVRRRRSLPGGRAVAGAFLVTAAAVGVFGAYLDATAAPTTQYVVAADDIAPGQVVDRADLDTVALEVPPVQRDQLVPEGRVDEVVGRVALGPVRAGDLVQWTTVLAVEPPDGASTFTFSIPASRVAYGGDLAVGDRIDLVATYGDTTRYVARDIALLQHPRAVAGDGGATITIAVDRPDSVLAIANALDAAQVFVVRSDPDAEADDRPAPFRPDAAPGGGS